MPTETLTLSQRRLGIVSLVTLIAAQIGNVEQIRQRLAPLGDDPHAVEMNTDLLAAGICLVAAKVRAEQMVKADVGGLIMRRSFIVTVEVEPTADLALVKKLLREACRWWPGKLMKDDPLYRLVGGVVTVVDRDDALEVKR